MSFRQFLPRRLLSNYRSIMNGNLVQNKDLDPSNLQLLQALLNESQASSPEEECIQKTVQFLYRSNTSSFYKFLVKNKLAYVVLWTESKCIVRHLGLQGLVYIRWNQDSRIYEVSLHKNVLAKRHQNNSVETAEHTAVDRIVEKISTEPEQPTSEDTHTWSNVVENGKPPEDSKVKSLLK